MEDEIQQLKAELKEEKQHSRRLAGALETANATIFELLMKQQQSEEAKLEFDDLKKKIAAMENDRNDFKEATQAGQDCLRHHLEMVEDKYFRMKNHVKDLEAKMSENNLAMLKARDNGKLMLPRVDKCDSSRQEWESVFCVKNDTN